MGTHPIFESDFDCLTDLCRIDSNPPWLRKDVDVPREPLLPSKRTRPTSSDTSQSSREARGRERRGFQATVLPIHQERHQLREHRGDVQEGPRRHPSRSFPQGQGREDCRQEAMEPRQDQLRPATSTCCPSQGFLPPSPRSRRVNTLLYLIILCA